MYRSCKREEELHLGAGAAERYRADFGLSTFNEGRGIFDWNSVVRADGETLRSIKSRRFSLTPLAVELEVGLNTLERRGRREVAGDLRLPTKDGFGSWLGVPLVNKAFNRRDNVDRSVSLVTAGSIGSTKFFEFRRDIVMIQSRALTRFEFVLSTDVCKGSLTTVDDVDGGR